MALFDEDVIHNFLSVIPDPGFVYLIPRLKGHSACYTQSASAIKSQGMNECLCTE